MLPSRRSFLWIVAALLSFSALLDVIVALKMSATTDELHHLRYGIHILHFRPDRTDGGVFDSQMPVSALNAAPQAIALSLERHNLFLPAAARLRLFRVARFPTILATLALTVMVCWWAYDLYGVEAAIASCVLCMLSPNLIAHGTLSTNDMYYALGVVGSLFFFRRFLLRPILANAVVSGVTLALAQVSKPFALSLYAVVAFVLVLALVLRNGPVVVKLKDVVVFAALAAASFIVVMNAAYSFYRPFVPLSSYKFQSTLLSQLQDTPFFQRVPIPVAYPFLQGLDLMKHLEETGEGMGNIYLLGEVGDSHDPAFTGFKSYYAVAWLFKEPIAIQVLFLWGLVWIWRHRSVKDILFGEGVLLAAAGLLVFWFSFFSRAQIGIRHILPALAIEIVIASAAFHNFLSMRWPKKSILSLLVLWLGISVASYYPHTGVSGR